MGGLGATGSHWELRVFHDVANAGAAGQQNRKVASCPHLNRTMFFPLVTFPVEAREPGRHLCGWASGHRLGGLCICRANSDQLEGQPHGLLCAGPRAAVSRSVSWASGVRLREVREVSREELVHNQC